MVIVKQGWTHFPVAPLLDVIEQRVAEIGWIITVKGDGEYTETKRAGAKTLFDHPGCPATHRSYERWLQLGTIREDMADKMAWFLGFHPYEIWGEEWGWVEDEEKEEVAA